MVDFQVDVAEQPGPAGVGARQHQADRMTDRLEHRAEENGHVVAVAGFELEHPPWCVEHLDSEWVLGVANVPLNPLEQRSDLSPVVLGPNAALEQNVDRLLADVEVLGPFPDQLPNVSRCAKGAAISPWNPAKGDPGSRRRRDDIPTHCSFLTRRGGECRSAEPTDDERLPSGPRATRDRADKTE